MIELLSPAGDEEKMRVAFNYGADAVYFGGQNYSLRANAKNFNKEEIKNAVILAHGLNKKVYVTVNIIFHDEDLFVVISYRISTFFDILDFRIQWEVEKQILEDNVVSYLQWFFS